MSQHPYTEDQLVEQPAIGLFAELSWNMVCALAETFGASGTLGREPSCEVVRQLNYIPPPHVVAGSIQTLRRTRDLLLPRLLSGQVNPRTN